MNKVFLYGNITRDPQVFENKVTVLKFNMATNEKFKSGDDWKERAYFHNVTVFGGKAEYLQSKLQKGMPVVVEGKNVSGSYEDKSGKRVYTYDVNALDVHIIIPRDKYKSEDNSGGDIDI